MTLSCCSPPSFPAGGSLKSYTWPVTFVSLHHRDARKPNGTLQLGQLAKVQWPLSRKQAMCGLQGHDSCCEFISTQAQQRGARSEHLPLQK